MRWNLPPLVNGISTLLLQKNSGRQILKNLRFWTWESRPKNRHVLSLLLSHALTNVVTARTLRLWSFWMQVQHSTPYQSAMQKHPNPHDPDPNFRCQFPCVFAPRCSFLGANRKDLRRHIAARLDPHRFMESICLLCLKAFYHGTRVNQLIEQDL